MSLKKIKKCNIDNFIDRNSKELKSQNQIFDKIKN